MQEEQRLLLILSALELMSDNSWEIIYRKYLKMVQILILYSGVNIDGLYIEGCRWDIET